MSDAFYDSFTSDDIRRIIAQNQILKRALIEAGKRQETEMTLLHLALHELAIANGAKDIPHFISRWQRKHRLRDNEGVPFG